MNRLTTAFALPALADERPNILFIFTDDHALQAISAYGGRFQKIAPTPNIDRIAKEGMIFRNSFCGNSICCPSRASIHRCSVGVFHFSRIFLSACATLTAAERPNIVFIFSDDHALEAI